jgi:hypothetical protein
MNLGVIHRVALRAENTVNHATSEKNYTNERSVIDNND